MLLFSPYLVTAFSYCIVSYCSGSNCTVSTALSLSYSCNVTASSLLLPQLDTPLSFSYLSILLLHYQLFTLCIVQCDCLTVDHITTITSLLLVLLCYFFPLICFLLCSIAFMLLLSVPQFCCFTILWYTSMFLFPQVCYLMFSCVCTVYSMLFSILSAIFRADFTFLVLLSTR